MSGQQARKGYPFLNPQPNLQNEVEAEAQRRKIKLMILPTAEAIEILKKAEPAETNAILHVTC